MLIVIRFDEAGAASSDNWVAATSLLSRLNLLLGLLLHHNLWRMLSRTLLHRDVDIILT